MIRKEYIKDMAVSSALLRFGSGETVYRDHDEGVCIDHIRQVDGRAVATYTDGTEKHVPEFSLDDAGLYFKDEYLVIVKVGHTYENRLGSLVHIFCKQSGEMSRPYKGICVTDYLNDRDVIMGSYDEYGRAGRGTTPWDLLVERSED